MLTEERKSEILKLLEVNDIVKNRDLMSLLDVSESTIRRDLQEMEEENLLSRIHGGARRVIKLEPELTMMEKAVKNTHEKRKIAEYAATLVNDGDYIYLDAGTTTYDMLPYLQGKKCHVITNSVYHATLSVDVGLATVIIGGEVRQKTKSVVSHVSLEQLKLYYFDKAFMGTNGIHVDYGYTTADTYEAKVKNVVISQAQRAYVLADSTKFNKVNFSKIADIDTASIITTTVPKELKQKLLELTTIKEVH
ncbi:DeoR/GlpR family DNA-binding transcription regulator [Vagococcus vulneris]|uniref:DeoR family transcriptional regulator n=1 Tax=Vagococcus vulneris TaxID=1977869 RepID=A0A429ZXE9_9ENTE|nr:DeoR/GlpR family DNA-binding transcription regulator [Vagococcus vulneris]RST98548.1 DeoR family transcriptional regulator [Vagococcus vulneris]